MALTVDWNGNIIIPAKADDERTGMLGTFKSVKDVNTYYPLPAAYSNLIKTSYLYKVPLKFAGRPDLIADEVYHSADLWWVILWANNIVDPFGRPNANEVINIIDIQDMKATLK